MTSPMTSATYLHSIELANVPDHLPAEVVHEIIRHGSRISTRLACNLCLVSSWVRDIALPGLFTFVTIDLDDKTDLLCDIIMRTGLMARPGAKVFKPSLRISAIEFRHRPYRVASIFTACMKTLENISLSGQGLLIILMTLKVGGITRVGEVQRLLRGRENGLDVLLTDNSYQANLHPLMSSEGNPCAELLDHIAKIRLPPVDESGSPHDPAIYNRFFTSLTHIALPISYNEIDLLVGLLEHPSLQAIVLLVSDVALYEAIQIEGG